MKSFKVQKLKNVSWNSCVALVNVTVLGPTGAEMLTIRDCKLIQGDFGSFVASPSTKVKEPYEDKNGKLVEYVDIVFFEKNARNELNDIVANAYDPNAELNSWYGDGLTDLNNSTVTKVSIDDLTTQLPS